MSTIFVQVSNLLFYLNIDIKAINSTDLVIQKWSGSKLEFVFWLFEHWRRKRKLLWTLTQSISKHSAFGSPDFLTRDHPSNSILCCCSVAKLCLTPYDAMNCSRQASCPPLYPGVCPDILCVNDAIQPSHSLLPPSPPTLNLSQHQSLFQWVDTLYQAAKVLELQLQHQSFQWIFRVSFL